MDLADLRLRFRIDATDTVTNPPLFEDEWIDMWLNDAQDEAAIRGRLLYAFADPAVCEIVTSLGQQAYVLHPSIYEIVSLWYRADGDSRGRELHLTSRENLDQSRCHWRDDRPGTPRYAMQDDRGLVFWPLVDRPGRVTVEGYRLPLKKMVDDGDKPEINAAHHRFLVYWALHKAFSRPDAETVDPTRAVIAEREFTKYFGIRPDSDLRREMREDEPHTNKPFWA